jgi:O-antigen ligase
VVKPSTASAPSEDGAPVAAEGRARVDVVEAIVFTMFLALPLVASSRFRDQFTTVKWYAFDAFAVLLVLAQVLRYRGHPLPGFLKKHWLPSVALALIAVFNCVRSGFPDAGQPLLERFTFVAAVLCLFWYFHRNRGDTNRIGVAVCAAAVVVDAYGMTQQLGYRPLPQLTAGDQRSSFFGNVNIAAQFLGFAILFLLSARTRPGRRAAGALVIEAILVTSFVYLYFLMCRSVFLALCCAATPWLLGRAVSIRILGRTLAAAGITVFLLVRGVVPGLASPSMSPEIQQAKASSVSIRLGLLQGTLRMIRENPTGVGSANYADQFVPYLSRGPLVPQESLLYGSPHNEYLRVLAEEGWAYAVLAGGLLAVFLRELHRSPVIDRWRSDQGLLLGSLMIFYAVESLFQFPLGMAVGSMMAAFIIALGLHSLSPGAFRGITPGVRAPIDRAATAAWLLAASAAAVGLYRTAASEYLFVNSQRRRVDLETACSLNPRNREACVLAAWRQVREGDHAAARRSLAKVLERSPYYYPAIKLLAEDAFARRETEEGCLYVWIYDGLFRNASSLHGFLVRRCPAEVREGFRDKVAMPRYGTFPLVPRLIPAGPGSPRVPASMRSPESGASPD